MPGPVTKLPLARWFQLMGVHPLHAFGVHVADLAPATGCSIPWLQHDWQAAERTSREDVAEAIAQAEEDIEKLLGYRLCPAWEVDEWQPTVRPYRPELINLSATDIRGFGQAVGAEWGHFISGGIEAKTLIQAAAVITVPDVDADGDGYFETRTVTIAAALVTAAAVTDPCEIAMFYPGTSGNDEYEIRPINASISAGGVATITFRRELTVLEAKLEAIDALSVDGLVNTNFLTTVDIYRRYNDPQTQVSFLWEPLGDCDCGNGDCLSCQFTTQTGCLMPRGDPKLSMLVYKPAEWDAASQAFNSLEYAISRQPDTVRLYYLAGLRDKSLSCYSREMPRWWERIVARYAASLLDRPVCGCIEHRVTEWQRDLAFSSGAEELASYSLSSGDLDCPLGTRRGALQAWKRIKQEALGEMANL